MYTRLEQKYQRRSQRQLILFILGSIVTIIILFAYGIPFLFNLTGTISSLKNKDSIVQKAKTIAPTIPEFSQYYSATATATIKLSGVADPKTTIEIFQNDRTLGTTVTADDGVFIQEVDLEKGQNTFTAVAINDNGDKSGVSQKYAISLLTSKPKLDVSSPKDGDSIGSSPVAITGQTDPGNTISVNDRLAIVNKDGKFVFNLDLAGGDNKIKIIASDLAGNQTTKELTVKYQ